MLRLFAIVLGTTVAHLYSGCAVPESNLNSSCKQDNAISVTIGVEETGNKGPIS